MQTKRNIIIISVIVVLLIAAGYLFLGKKPASETAGTPVSTSTSTSSVATASSTNSAVPLSNGSGVTATGDYKIEKVAIPEGNGLPQPMPSLSRAVIFTDSLRFSTEEKAIVTAKVTELQASLKSNAANFPAWLDLGMYQKKGGDYAGAALSWEYAGKLIPKSYIPPANLGNLYAYFIGDTNKAVVYYKQAIDKEPTQGYLYIQLAEVYRDLRGDSVTAKATVDLGLSRIPSDPNLLQLKETFK